MVNDRKSGPPKKAAEEGAPKSAVEGTPSRRSALPRIEPVQPPSAQRPSEKLQLESRADAMRRRSSEAQMPRVDVPRPFDPRSDSPSLRRSSTAMRAIDPDAHGPTRRQSRLSMERVAPPPLPSVLPKVDVRVLMSDHAEGLFAELEHFVMLAGTVCVQHGIPVGWEELVAFRRTVAGQINDLLDQFGPLRDDHHHTVVDISDTAELLESMRPPKR